MASDLPQWLIGRLLALEHSCLFLTRKDHEIIIPRTAVEEESMTVVAENDQYSNMKPPMGSTS